MIEKEVLSKIGINRSEELTNEDILNCRMSVAKIYDGQSFLMSFKERCFLVQGDITAIKGRAKSGKTHFLTVLIAALLNGKFSQYKALENDLSILHIDTEQGMLNFQTIIKKALKMGGFSDARDHDRLHTFSLREISAKERTRAVVVLVEAYSRTFLSLMVSGIFCMTLTISHKATM